MTAVAAGAALRLRSARPGEARALTDLAMRSKAHWGYDRQFMDQCRAELTVSPERMAAECTVVAERGSRIVGFSSFLPGLDGAAEVTMCFVEPDRIGRGVGRLLLTEVIDQARAGGLVALTLDSDPRAEGFYQRQGFRRIGTAPSGSIPGRYLPRLRLDL